MPRFINVSLLKPTNRVGNAINHLGEGLRAWTLAMTVEID
jgi:hypothetical protein